MVGFDLLLIAEKRVRISRWWRACGVQHEFNNLSLQAARYTVAYYCLMATLCVESLTVLSIHYIQMHLNTSNVKLIRICHTWLTESEIQGENVGNLFIMFEFETLCFCYL